MGKQDRLLKYVIKNDFTKLGPFLRQYPDVKNKTLLKGKNAVELCAKWGHGDCLKVLLDAGAKVGSSTLHLALKHCLKSGDNPHELNRELIRPLMNHAASEKLEDKTKLLLDAWEMKLRPVSESTTSESDENDEWVEKLKNAAEDDRVQYLGSTYEEEFANCYRETFDEWADRIHKEFYKKKRKEPRPSPKAEQKSKPPFGIPGKQLKLKCDRKAKYEKLFALDHISAKDFPFTKETSSDKILELILGSEPDRSRIREAIRLWHPDKFFQKYGDKIEDKESVSEIVTRVSQILLNFGLK